MAYPYFAVIDFNDHPTVSGRNAPGSGIFLHAWVNGPTAGCVALPLGDLVPVLRWLEPSKHPVIEIGTDSEVGRVPPAGAARSRGRSRGRPPRRLLARRQRRRCRALRPGAPAGQPGVEPGAGSTPRSRRWLRPPTASGYWVTTGSGHVYQYGNAGFFGSPFQDGRRSDLVGIAPLPEGKRLLTS